MALVSAGSFAPSAPLLLRLAAGADDFTAGLPHCAVGLETPRFRHARPQLLMVTIDPMR